MQLSRLVIIIVLLVLPGLRSQAQNSLRYNWYFQFTEKYPDSCIHLLRTDTSLREHIGEIESQYLYARAYHNVGKFDSSIYLAEQSMREYPQGIDSNFFYEFQLLNAENYRIEKEFDKTITLLFSSLRYHQTRKDTPRLVHIGTRMVEFYRTMENLTEAKVTAGYCFDLISEYSKDIPDLRASLYNRTAAVLVQEGTEIDSAKILCKKVVRLARKARNRELEASSYNELGFIYHNTGEDSALYYYLLSKDIYGRIKYSRYLTNVMLNLSRYYIDIGELENARIELTQVIANSQENGFEIILADAYEMLARLMSLEGRYEEAYEYLEKSSSAKLEIQEKAYSQSLMEIQSRFQLEEARRLITEKEQEVDRLNSEVKVENLEQKQAYIMFLGLLIVLIIVAYFLYGISAKNRELKKSRSMLENSNKELAQLIGQKEVLLQEVHHRVKNNLSILSSMLYLQRKSLKNEEAVEALSNSQNRISTIALIHESLYQRNDMDHVNFQDYLEKLCLSIKDSFGPGYENVEIRIDCAELNPKLEESIPLAMIINELLTNSFKHAFKNVEKPLIGLQYQASRKTLKVFDNGGGTLRKKKNSLGLKLIEIFCEQLDSKFETETRKNFLVNYIIFKDSFES